MARQGFQPGDIGVLSREKTGVEAALSALKAAGVSAVVVDRTDRSPRSAACRS